VSRWPVAGPSGSVLKPRERERKSIILLEGSQATPARPSGRKCESEDVMVIGGGFRQRAEF
jgi:hypothetical protein